MVLYIKIQKEVNNLKKVKNLIILSVIIIVIIILVINFIKNKEKIQEEKYNIQIVSQTDEYFQIVTAIQTYYEYVNEGSVSKAYNLLDKEYINRYDITEETISKNCEEIDTDFIPQKISVVKIDEYSKIYFVKGVSYKVTKERTTSEAEEEDDIIIDKLEELEHRKYKENVCYIVKVDSENSSFAISKDISKYQEVFDAM